MYGWPSVIVSESRKPHSLKALKADSLNKVEQAHGTVKNSTQASTFFFFPSTDTLSLFADTRSELKSLSREKTDLIIGVVSS